MDYNNLSPELQELLAAAYPTGYGNSIIRIQHPNKDPFFAVTLETEDTTYLVKIQPKPAKKGASDAEDFDNNDDDDADDDDTPGFGDGDDDDGFDE